MDKTISKSNTKPMGRPPKFRIPTLIRLDRGVGTRMDKLLRGKEKRVDLIRAAVDREIRRREALEKKKLREFMLPCKNPFARHAPGSAARSFPRLNMEADADPRDDDH
jgi:hypothetical protein